jgi:hypothetical protein
MNAVFVCLSRATGCDSYDLACTALRRPKGWFDCSSVNCTRSFKRPSRGPMDCVAPPLYAILDRNIARRMTHQGSTIGNELDGERCARFILATKPSVVLYTNLKLPKTLLPLDRRSITSPVFLFARVCSDFRNTSRGAPGKRGGSRPCGDRKPLGSAVRTLSCMKVCCCSYATATSAGEALPCRG